MAALRTLKRVPHPPVNPEPLHSHYSRLVPASILPKTTTTTWEIERSLPRPGNGVQLSPRSAAFVEANNSILMRRRERSPSVERFPSPEPRLIEPHSPVRSKERYIAARKNSSSPILRYNAGGRPNRASRSPSPAAVVPAHIRRHAPATSNRSSAHREGRDPKDRKRKSDERAMKKCDDLESSDKRPCVRDGRRPGTIHQRTSNYHHHQSTEHRGRKSSFSRSPEKIRVSGSRRKSSPTRLNSGAESNKAALPVTTAPSTSDVITAMDMHSTKEIGAEKRPEQSPEEDEEEESVSDEESSSDSNEPGLDLFASEESESETEGRFKSAKSRSSRISPAKRGGAISFSSLINKTAVITELKDDSRVGREYSNRNRRRRSRSHDKRRTKHHGHRDGDRSRDRERGRRLSPVRGKTGSADKFRPTFNTLEERTEKGKLKRTLTEIIAWLMIGIIILCAGGDGDKERISSRSDKSRKTDKRKTTAKDENNGKQREEKSSTNASQDKRRRGPSSSAAATTTAAVSIKRKWATSERNADNAAVGTKSEIRKLSKSKKVFEVDRVVFIIISLRFCLRRQLMGLLGPLNLRAH